MSSTGSQPPPPPYSTNPPNLSSPPQEQPQQGNPNPQQTPAQQQTTNQQPPPQLIPQPQPFAQYYYPIFPQAYTSRPQYYPAPAPFSQIPIYTYLYPVSPPPPVFYNAYPAVSPPLPPPYPLQLRYQYSQLLHLQPRFIQPQPQTPPPSQGPQNGGNGNMQIIPYPQTGFIPHPPAIIPGIPGIHSYPLIVRKEGSGPPPAPVFVDLE